MLRFACICMSSNMICLELSVLSLAYKLFICLQLFVFNIVVLVFRSLVFAL